METSKEREEAFHVHLQQKLRPHESANLMSIIEYIRLHDHYRQNNKVTYYDARHHAQPARKGTKRYKKEQKKASRLERRRQIERVNQLLAILDIS